ncbi:hypothetical protein EG328_005348 [Venturia inaequalis]|uniref:Uncharacterized protein n=1 Tax=Venturia inaequalis TaxID=5025 RepID=A0A8H3YY28_VENIN|nr:hypothetical protein EG328_005348 [Venturia inaequalis]KAE9978054.1 hypothetical protein EG327_007527 [Venturia inaequalis]
MSKMVLGGVCASGMLSTGSRRIQYPIWTFWKSGRSPHQLQQRQSSELKDNERVLQRWKEACRAEQYLESTLSQEKSIGLPEPGIKPVRLTQPHMQTKHQVPLATEYPSRGMLYVPLTWQQGGLWTCRPVGSGQDVGSKIDGDGMAKT